RLRDGVRRNHAFRRGALAARGPQGPSGLSRRRLTRTGNDSLQRGAAAGGKVLRTFWRLFCAPGVLTVDYFRGMRAEYLPPVPLLLIAGTAFFIVTAGMTPSFATFVPKVMLGLLPLFALLTWLLYRNRRQSYTAHLMFALHYHALVLLV